LSAMAPKPLQGDRFRVGDYLVDPRLNRVIGPDGETSLQPKIMDVLCLLAERQGETLSRNEIIDRIWGVEFGGDESLTRAISQLRKLFGDTREEPRIIETIAKRGYRLIPPVLPPDQAEGQTATVRRGRRRLFLVTGLIVLLLALAVGYLLLRPQAPPPPRAERTGIVVAVAPFIAEAGTPAAPGMAEELSTAIARSPLVRTRTTDTVRERPEPMLYVLRGSLQRVGPQIRVNAQLADAASGDVIWGETYDRPFDPSFSERGSVVQAIGSEMLLPLLRSVKARLAARPVTELAPWELTLLVTWVPGDEVRPSGPPVEDSYWLQRRALELDPDFAPAHALFGELASYHAMFHPPADTQAARARAERHAARAIELAPYDAEVLYQVALHYRYAGDRERARSLLERVIQLQPSHPIAPLDLEFVRGQCDDGAATAIARLQSLERAMSRSNPTRWVAFAHLSALHLSQGEFAQAREAARQARTIVPVTWTAMPLAAADAELGQTEEAAAVLAEHRREWPNMDLHYFAEQVVPRWCLHGARTEQVHASFRRLADRLAPRR